MVKDRNSAGVDGNALAGIYAFLDKNVPSPPPPTFPDIFYYDIAERLEDEDELTEWRTRPRLFLLLYLAGVDHCCDAGRALLDHDVPDTCVPLQQQLLPTIVKSDKVLLRKLQNEQEHVYSDRESIDKDPYITRGYRSHWHIRSGDVYYEIERTLGSGGSGSVDKVQHRVSGKVYARKQLLRGVVSTHQQRQSKELEQQHLKEFDQELKALKRIRKLTQDVPQLAQHFVDLAASYTDRKSFALLMCPVADSDLRSLLSSPALTSDALANVRKFPGCLAAAIKFLHEHSIRHKDIKPSNILVKSGTVMLCDFGISRDYTDATNGLTTSGPTPFTRNYAAPEVIERGNRNASADIFSLGCCFLEIATVVCGRSIQDMSVWLETTGNFSLVAALNPPGVASWVLQLQSSLSEGSPLLDWVIRMFNFPTMNISEVDRVTYGDSSGRVRASDLVSQINEQAKIVPVPERFIGNCCCAHPVTEPSPYPHSTIASPRLSAVSGSMSSAHPSPLTRNTTTQSRPTSIPASVASMNLPFASGNATPGASDRSSQISRIQAVIPTADSPMPGSYETLISPPAAPTERMDSLGISVRSIATAATVHACEGDDGVHCCFTGKVTSFADRSKNTVKNISINDRMNEDAGGYGLCLSATGGPEVWKKAWHISLTKLSEDFIDERAGFWLPSASFHYTLSDRRIQLSWFNSNPSRDWGSLSMKESSYRTPYHLREPNCVLEITFDTHETARTFITALRSPPANVSIPLTPLLNQAWKHATLSFTQTYLAQGLPILDHQILHLDEGYRASDSGNAYTCSTYYAWRDLDFDLQDVSDHALELVIRNLSSTIYQPDLQRLSVPMKRPEEVTEQASLVRDVLKMNVVREPHRSDDFIKLSGSADITRILATLTMWRPLAVCFPAFIYAGQYSKVVLSSQPGYSVIVWRKGSDANEKPTISIRVRRTTESQGSHFVTGIAYKVGEDKLGSVYLDVRCFRKGAFLDIRDMTASIPREDEPAEAQERLTFNLSGKAHADFLKLMKDLIAPQAANPTDPQAVNLTDPQAAKPTDSQALARAARGPDPINYSRRKGFRERLFGTR